MSDVKELSKLNSGLIDQSRSAIQKGSKSFAMASMFFDQSQKENAWLLYRWCRHCDDQIDEAGSQEEALQRLDELREQTLSCFAEKVPSHPVFQSLQKVVQKCGIPQAYPMDMLAGMELDVRSHEYMSFAELDYYCYCVAGTVGLMMVHVMGVSEERAVDHAVAMGKAMQMTNIARDVRTDYNMGRVYLPKEWLQEFSLDKETLFASAKRDSLVSCVGKLLAKAEESYRYGDQGLIYLNWRAAWACGSARRIYSEIGNQVRRRQGQAWDQRCYTGLFTKTFLSARALTSILLSTPQRWSKPKENAQIQRVWQPEWRVPPPGSVHISSAPPEAPESSV